MDLEMKIKHDEQSIMQAATVKKLAYQDKTSLQEKLNEKYQLGIFK